MNMYIPNFLEGADSQEVLNTIISILGVSLVCITIVYAYALPISRTRFSNIFLGIGIALFYINFVSNYEDEQGGDTYNILYSIGFDQKWERKFRKLDILLCITAAMFAIICSLYVEMNYLRLRDHAVIVGFNEVDYIIGVLILTIVIDSTRRAYGYAITLVMIFSIIYALFGSWFPGLLYHPGWGVEQLIRRTVLELSGVYGFILGVGTTWIAIFIFFAGIAKIYGLTGYLLTVGNELGKSFRSGVVLTAVTSSMIIGSITGSAAANTATTGAFTIPMMKRQGIEERYAAAIESVASSGGQILPPVMGIAAFLMADTLGVPYRDIVAAGTLPAILFYFSLVVILQLLVYKNNWGSVADKKFNSSALLAGYKFLPSIFILFYTLFILRLTPLSAGLYTIVVLLLSEIFYCIYHSKIEITTLKQYVGRTMRGFIEGSKDMAPLVGVLAGLGIIVGVLTQTGLTQRLSFYLLSLSGGYLLAILFIAMVASILFGLGMPTGAAYIVVAILVAPALVNAGVSEISAHFFVFYFAALSAITPPVAIAVVIATRIADSDFMHTSKEALRIGLIGFIVPYIFIYNEAIMSISLYRTPYMLLMIIPAIVLLAFSIIGHNSFKALSLRSRTILFSFGLITAFYPDDIRLIFSIISYLLILYPVAIYIRREKIIKFPGRG